MGLAVLAPPPPPFRLYFKTIIQNLFGNIHNLAIEKWYHYCINYLLLLNKLSKVKQLKAAHIYNLTVHGTRNLGRLSLILCSRVSQAQSRCQIRLQALPGGVAGEGTAPRLTSLLVGFSFS